MSLPPSEDVEGHPGAQLRDGPNGRDTSSALIGAFCVGGAAVLWALIGIFTKHLNGNGVRAVDIAWWRASGAGCLFVLNLKVIGGRLTVPRREVLPLVGFAGVGVSIFYFALPAAVLEGGVTVAYVLLYTAPIWVVVGHVVMTRRPPSRVAATSVLIGTAGVIAVVLGSSGNARLTPLAVALGLCAGLSYSAYYLVGSGLFLRLGPTQVYAVALCVGSIPLGIAAGFSLPSGSEWMWVGALCLVSTWLPYVLLGEGLRRLSPVRSVIIANLEPVVAACLAAVLFGERLGMIAIIGAVLVVAASMLSSLGAEQV